VANELDEKSDFTGYLFMYYRYNAFLTSRLIIIFLMDTLIIVFLMDNDVPQIINCNNFSFDTMVVCKYLSVY